MAGHLHVVGHIAGRVLVDLGTTVLGLASGTLLGVAEWTVRWARRRRN